MLWSRSSDPFSRAPGPPFPFRGAAEGFAPAPPSSLHRMCDRCFPPSLLCLFPPFPPPLPSPEFGTMHNRPYGSFTDRAMSRCVVPAPLCCACGQPTRPSLPRPPSIIDPPPFSPPPAPLPVARLGTTAAHPPPPYCHFFSCRPGTSPPNLYIP